MEDQINFPERIKRLRTHKTVSVGDESDEAFDLGLLLAHGRC